nr:type II/IV secretion system ATPase subunit [Methanocella sp. CWC-04]
MNINLHDEDRKNFYGLLKKKQTEKENEQRSQVATEPITTSVGDSVDGAKKSPGQGPEKLDKDDTEKVVSDIDSPAAETPVSVNDEPEALKSIFKKTAMFEAAQQETTTATESFIKDIGLKGTLSHSTEVPGESIVSPSSSSKSEEDIINEFNALLNKGTSTEQKETAIDAQTGISKVKDKKKIKKTIEFEPYNPDKHGPMSVFPGVAGYEEIERYWVIEPYSFIVILYNEQTNNYLYYVVEPSLTVFEKELLEEVYERLQDVLVLEDLDTKTDKKELLKLKTTEVINDYIGKIDTKSYHKILYYIQRDYLEFGKINAIMHDNFIEDISNNGFDTPVFLYHKNYENIMTNITFSEKQLDSFVIKLAQRCGKHISIAEPMVDATMPDGSRIQMTLGKEITTRGSTFTIRKFKDIPITPIDLIAWNTFSSETMAYMWICIENNKSLIFSGGTASGKTSSLNAVALFIPPKAKVISLEDTRELKLPHQNWIPGLTRDSFTADGKGAIEMFALLKAALRQRPEYLLVGEVRGKEALTLFQAMSTGHTTFSTMHADSVESAIHRLENPPISVPRTMITALNIISIQSQTYLRNKRVRRNMKLVEIHDIDPNTRNIRTNDIYVWNSGTDRFDRVGESRMLAEIAQRRAWSRKDLSTEVLRRQRVLEYMVKNNIRDFKQVSAIIQAYSVRPDRVLEKLGIRD